MFSARLLSTIGCLCVFAASQASAVTTTGNYYVGNGSSPCLLLDVELSYSAVRANNKILSSKIAPESGEISGTCGNTNDAIPVSTAILESSNSTAEFTFRLNKTAQPMSWMITKVTVTIDLEDGNSMPLSNWEETALSNGNDNIVLNVTTGANGYSAGVNATYQCMSGSNWTLSNGTAQNGLLSTLNFRAQPFYVTGNFSNSVVKCSGDLPVSTSNVVPIAVGAALCGLVLIVLIAYIIGRSRHQRSKGGYQSV